MQMAVKMVDGKMIAIGKVVNGKLYPLDEEVPRVDLKKAVAALDKAVQEEWGEPLGKIAGLDKGEVSFRLEKAASAGKIDSRLLSAFDVNPLGALADVPKNVAEEFELPVVDEEWAKSHRPSALPWWLRLKKRMQENELRKSAQTVTRSGLTKAQIEDTSEKLEKAANEGALDSRVLSDFNVNPLWALGSIPSNIAHAYGLPQIDPETAAAASPVRTPLGWDSARRHAVAQDAYRPQSPGLVEHDSLSKTELREAEKAVDRAVLDHVLPSWLAGDFPTRPYWVLGEVPEPIARQYKIPRVTGAAAAAQSPYRR